MTITRELTVSLADVFAGGITLKCEACKTMITLDLSDPMDLQRRGQFPPKSCAVCGVNFDSAWARIDSLRAAYRELKGFGDQISFRVQLRDQAGA